MELSRTHPLAPVSSTKIAAVEKVRGKGMNFRTALQMLERMKGKVMLQAIIEQMPPESRDAIRYGRIVAGGWYPVSWYRELHASAQRVCRAGPELARAIGHDATVEDFRGIYRYLLAMLSPEFIFSQAPKLLQMYWEGGEAEKVEVRKGMGSLRFRGWKGFDRNVWEDIMGSTEGLLELCNSTAIRRRIIAGGDDTSGELWVEFRWL